MTGEPIRALITGLSGQDGSFLAEQLLDDARQVTGVVRGGPDGDLGCAEPLRHAVTLVGAELLDPQSLTALVADQRPDELYHLAAPTFVPASWEDPAETLRAITVATATLLQAVRDHSPQTRILIASSCEIFGEAGESPQREDSPCRPRTPYATAKLAAHQLVGQMRTRDGIHACSAILYNHESERRPANFVTRKITRAAAEIKLGIASEVTLGDTSAVRDWSYAGDIMAGCRQILAGERPADYILASGVGHTVQDFVEAAFAHVGLDPATHVRTDPSLVRPPETTAPVGDPGRARRELGWEPQVSFEQLVARMVDADLAFLAAADGQV